MPEKYRIKSTVERPFVLQTLRHLRPVFAELARNKQTTGLGQITVADLKQLRVVKPPLPLILRWNEVVSPLLDEAFLTQQQAEPLATLRDTLLPSVNSGQLRLTELANQDEETVR